MAYVKEYLPHQAASSRIKPHPPSDLSLDADADLGFAPAVTLSPTATRPVTG